MTARSRFFLILLVLLCPFSNANGQEEAFLKVTSEDLQFATGNWRGSLTYLDYSSGKPYKMAAELLVSNGRNARVLILQNTYPKEPKANSSQKLRLSRSGKKLNGSLIVSKETFSSGAIKITTIERGKDDGMPAEIRMMYSLGASNLIIEKAIRFVGEDKWITRSTYSYNRHVAEVE